MIKTTLATLAILSSALAFAGPGGGTGTGRPSTLPGGGAYKALAYGVKQNPHGSSYGFYARGFGNTQAEANAQALDRCNTISSGYGCILVDE